MKKVDPFGYFSRGASQDAYRETGSYAYVTPPPPYDLRRHGTGDHQRATSGIEGLASGYQGGVNGDGPGRRTSSRTTGKGSLKKAGNQSLCAFSCQSEPEEKAFVIDQRGGSKSGGWSDLASRQRVNVLRHQPDSPQGSTFSSPRSSISTLASASELRHLGGSPYSACSPSPALEFHKSHSPLARGPCPHCRSAGSPVGFNRFPASPADTVIIHDRSDSTQWQGGQPRLLSAARHHGLYTGFSCTCHGIDVLTGLACQHGTTPPLIGNRPGGALAPGVVKHCATHHCHQQPSRQSPAFSLPSTTPAGNRTTLASSTSLHSIAFSPGLLAFNNKSSALSSSPGAPPSSAAAAAWVNKQQQFYPAFSQQCGAPLGRNCFHTATVCAKNEMNRSRDISAPVFSQACSEELDEPPPYKPPASRPKLPTTTAKNINRSVNVEKKIEQLTEELSNISSNLCSTENENFDEEDYYGQCYACSERVVGEEHACQAMGNLYHTSCFICNICGRILRGKAFYHVKGQIMCEEDYLYSGFQSSADKCVACGHLIMDMILQALGKSYHPGCFRCCTCNKTLDGAPFTVDIEGKIFCIEDYQGRYAPTCASCKQPITPVEGSDETVRVVSMEQNFHVDCYACEDCGLQLTDKPKDRRCYPLDGHLLCHACHMKRREKDHRSSSSARSSIRSRQPVQQH